MAHFDILGVPVSKQEYAVIRPYIVKEAKRGMRPTAETVRGYLRACRQPEVKTEAFHGFAVSPSEKQILTAVVTMETQAGARFTRTDIKDLIYSGRYPSAKEKADMARFSKEIDKSNRRYEKEQARLHRYGR